MPVRGTSLHSVGAGGQQRSSGWVGGGSAGTARPRPGAEQHAQNQAAAAADPWARLVVPLGMRAILGGMNWPMVSITTAPSRPPPA